MKFAVEGDDRRMRYAAEELAAMGCEVCERNDLFDIPSEGVLAVSPGMRPDGLTELIMELPEGLTLIGGQHAEAVYRRAQERGVRYVCVTDDEAFAQANAVATAEGAAELILRLTEELLCGMRMGIVGFGRVGSALAVRLAALGARVRVFARSSAARACAMMYDTAHTDDIQAYAPECRVLVNTVPARIIPQSCIDVLPKDALLIELASPPYGYDAEYAVSTGRVSVLAAGLPSVAAPRSAAHFLAEAIVRISTERSF